MWAEWWKKWERAEGQTAPTNTHTHKHTHSCGTLHPRPLRVEPSGQLQPSGAAQGGGEQEGGRCTEAEKWRGGGASGAALGGQWRCSEACQHASRSPLSLEFLSLPHSHSSSAPLSFSIWIGPPRLWGGGRGALRTGNDSSSFSTNTREVELSVKL